MYITDKPQPAPARRRIIQQPLRTEAPFALIAGDNVQTAELEARLKRDQPLITFPSISHFLAEPARREPWAAVVIARAGAWDPRFDSQVRRRRSIALFGLAEEGYGWPETVARVRDLTELSAWLEGLNAPEPAHIKEAVKRERRAQAKAALSELSASWLKQSASAARSTTRASSAPAAATVSTAPKEAASLPLAAAAGAQETTHQTRAVQLELSALASDLSLALESARVAPEPKGSAPRKARKVRVRAPELPAGVPPVASVQRELIGSVLTRGAARFDYSTPANPLADREFTRIAAELGLVRAVALLDELRERATRLALSMTRNAASAR